MVGRFNIFQKGYLSVLCVFKEFVEAVLVSSLSVPAGYPSLPLSGPAHLTQLLQSLAVLVAFLMLLFLNTVWPEQKTFSQV